MPSTTEICISKKICLKLKENPSQGISFQLWPAATVLSECIANDSFLEIKGSTVLELGSGCGLVGLTAYALEAKNVILTDTLASIDHLQENIILNKETGYIRAETLEWGDQADIQRIRALGHFDYILLSDCTYWQHLHSRLLQTLELLSEESTTILLAHQWRRRPVEESFFERLFESFRVTKQVKDQMDSEHECTVFYLKLKETVISTDEQLKRKNEQDNSDELDVAALLERIRLMESDIDSIEAADGAPVSEN